MPAAVSPRFFAAPAAPPDRRRVTRIETSRIVAVEGAAGERFETPLSDVSVFGCSIRSDAPWIRPGRVLSLSLDGTPAIQAIVRWVSDGAAGMEFMREIPRGRAEWHALLD